MQENTPSPEDMSRDLGEDIQVFLQEHGPQIAFGVESSADPGGILATLSNLRLDNTKLRYGVVRYTIPHFDTYLVTIATGATLPCRRSKQGSYSFGGIDTGVLSHNTAVYVMVDDAEALGTIVGTVPPILFDPTEGFSDFISQGSGVGAYASPHYRDYVSILADNGGAIPFKGDMPLDALPGDQGFTTCTGVGWHLDCEMLYTRASELCGLFLFREDGNARLTGESLSIESLYGTSQSGIGAYECYAESQESLYPWEAMGSTIPGVGIGTDEIGAASAYRTDGKGVLEPDIAVSPVTRLDRFGGYVGQGELLTVSAPQTQALNADTAPIQRAGLFRQQTLIDGSHITETTGQLFLAKTFSTPTITRIGPPDLVAPDVAYKHSGILGDDGAPDHIVSRLPSEGMAMAPEEAYAYMSGWQGLHAAVLNPATHVEYFRPDTDSLAVDLSQTDYVTASPGGQVYIDHRYGNVTNKQTTSFFALLDDGTPVMRDGHGAEIKLVNGVVEISGTAVYINAAKRFSAMSGEVSIRANRDAELVSSTGALRLKSDQDLLLLAANSGTGTLLLESRSTSLQSNWQDTPEASTGSGVVIKSATSHISLLSGDILLKTGSSSAGLRNGQIVIDAGNQSIISKSAEVHRFVSGGYYDHFGTSPSSVESTNVYEKTYNRLTGSLGVADQLVIGGGVIAGRSIVTVDGTFGDARGVGIGKIKDLAENREQLTEMHASRTARTDSGKETLAAQEETLESENRPGNIETIANTSFGFKSSTSYGAGSLVLNQPYWQRALTSQTNTWEEPVVQYQRSDNSTRPWPGNDTWVSPSSFLYLSDENRYFDQTTGLPIDPNVASNRELYEAGKIPAVNISSIKDNMRTI